MEEENLEDRLDIPKKRLKVTATLERFQKSCQKIVRPRLGFCGTSLPRLGAGKSGNDRAVMILKKDLSLLIIKTFAAERLIDFLRHIGEFLTDLGQGCFVPQRRQNQVSVTGNGLKQIIHNEVYQGVGPGNLPHRIFPGFRAELQRKCPRGPGIPGKDGQRGAIFGTGKSFGINTHCPQFGRRSGHKRGFAGGAGHRGLAAGHWFNTGNRRRATSDCLQRVINVGLISGFIRIGDPGRHKRIGVAPGREIVTEGFGVKTAGHDSHFVGPCFKETFFDHADHREVTGLDTLIEFQGARVKGVQFAGMPKTDILHPL
ncbi:MAG: hypothetical protein BWY49_00096 [Candidatus Omnitrophica bacterium ADurb.Bin314]|nr:MAG: hypothetical protein BWY49_00096 [Candidatus Omnitrophica bacterium ADurb.Bin314]